ncbi:serine hydrolase domain-containing protein [Niastella caeni]|uniref:serine hydrolase domain-containing protein n=1 Tax=Niastella caeni TaxID=2569763 RepID=UPI00140B936F|nr:serine hydrolase domain-containing protein [Niastella caeni]
MKNLVRLLLVVLALQSCARVNNKKVTSAPANDDTSSLPAHATPLTPEEISRYKRLVSNHLDSTLNKTRFNGSVLVAKNGQIVYEEYAGFVDPRTKRDSITPTTPFHLASVSKTFTGMATLRLWEEGRLNVEDPVSKYLPGFPLEGVTVRLLLNHRSGIPKYDHYMGEMGWDKHKMISNQDVLDFLIANHQKIPIGTPNRGFSYSNTNYALLALIIEKVSGLSYKDYLKKTFFDPLGMKDTYVFTLADSARYMPSFYYSNREYRFEFLDAVYGDKNIYSTVRDLLKWDQALQTEGFFKKATLDQAYAGYSFEKPGTHNYGLGWRMYLLKNGKKLIYHNGWWHGNRTSFYRMTDENATIIALANNDCRYVYKVKEMADIFGDYMQKHKRYDDDEPTQVAHVQKPVKRRSHATAYKKKSTSRRSTAKK